MARGEREADGPTHTQGKGTKASGRARWTGGPVATSQPKWLPGWDGLGLHWGCKRVPAVSGLKSGDEEGPCTPAGPPR